MGWADYNDQCCKCSVRRRSCLVPWFGNHFIYSSKWFLKSSIPCWNYVLSHIFLVKLGLSSFPMMYETFGITGGNIIPSWEQTRTQTYKKYGNFGKLIITWLNAQIKKNKQVSYRSWNVFKLAFIKSYCPGI